MRKTWKDTAWNELYLLLCETFPEYEVDADVDLGGLTPQTPDEERLLPLLAGLRVDYTFHNPATRRIAAAIDVGPPDPAKEERLRAVGIRFVAFDRAQLPDTKRLRETFLT